MHVGFRRMGGAGAALVLMTLFLLPARHTALRGDDVFTFPLTGRLDLTGGSLLAHIAGGVWETVSGGRPQPLGGVWGNLVIAAFEGHREAYKLFLVLLTVACAGLLYLLVRRLGAAREVGAMVVLLVAGAIQFRQYHDPVLGYYGTTQIMLACVLGSLLLQLRYLRGGRRGHLVAAVALYAAAILFYEIAGTMALAHLALAVSERRVRSGLPFLGVAFAFVLYGFVLRALGAGDQSGGYSAAFAAGEVVRTYLVQLLPPLPGANLIFGGEGLRERPTAPELLGAAWRALVVLAAVLWAGLRAPREGSLRTMALVGAALVISPVALIAFAEKYQRELSAATGYLPVIAQSFGWGLLAGAAVMALARVHRGLVVGAAAVLAAGAAISGFDVLRVAAVERPTAAVTDAMRAAAERGLLNVLPEGSTVLFPEGDVGAGSGTGWGHRHALDAMLRDASGRRYDARVTPAAGVGTCDADDAAAIPLDCGPVAARSGWLRASVRRGQAVVFLATISGGPLGRPADTIAAYVEGDGPPPLLRGTTTAGTPWTSEGLSWNRRGDVLVAEPAEPRPVADTLLDARRAIDLGSPPPPADLVRVLGTRGVLP